MPAPVLEALPSPTSRVPTTAETARRPATGLAAMLGGECGTMHDAADFGAAKFDTPAAAAAAAAARPRSPPPAGFSEATWTRSQAGLIG